MKKILLIFISLIITTVAVFIIFLNLSNRQKINIPPPSDIDTDKVVKTEPSPQLTKGFKTVWIAARDPNKIFLYSNLENVTDSKKLATENSCAQLVSGGFYDTGGNHIGLFISDGKIINESQENRTFNGYFNISSGGKASISEYPVFSPRISVQSGPILMKNSILKKLTLENDENARRLAVAVTKEGLIYYLAVYDQENSYSGPKLKDLPDIVGQISENNGLDFYDVINLDGGAHSAFLSNIASLSEASPIGSYFCIKP